MEQDWIPEQDSCSLYIRPTMISTEPSLGVKPTSSASLFVLTGPVGPYFNTGTFKPVSLLADPSFIRAWPGGVGDCKAGGNYGPTIYAQRIAQTKGCSQCLWLYNDEVTEVGTMNIFMSWINEDGVDELITPDLNGLILPGITRDSLLNIAREWNEFKVTEKSFTIQQLEKAVHEGRVKEIFGAGTACVVCPVDKILWKDEFLDVESRNGFPLAQRFYKELTDIQYGRTSHPWRYLVDTPRIDADQNL
jgi:branched-chain amino acid aminotransferase